MNASNEMLQSPIVINRLSLFLRVSGLILFIGTVTLAARLIWEQTVWTWERGPQMIGYSLAHGYGAILLLFPFALILWTLVVVVLTVRSRLKKRRIGRTRWVVLGLVALLFVVMGLPDGFWQKAFISRMAASPRAGDLLMSAAAQRDFSLVRTYISHGVPVNASDRTLKETPLHAAASQGDLKIVEFLVLQGADVNMLDRFGDSPLELAAAHAHDATANFLSQRGAQRVRGTDAQRKKAMHDLVEEDIKSLDK